ncbi:UNVERIFIED_CONTAM: Aspartyl protease family protein [Sesamum radiatum]|uniref:Aspartyl protease family protein n=1 Tax=Sesamum radiatum TaxID=300843 RepID=A0AAW2JRW1_SESRA
MAHNHHHPCTSFSLMIIIIKLLLLSSSSVDALQTHTLEINTLFPAPVCTAAAANIQGQDKDSAATIIPSLSEVLSHDQSRVDLIQARVKPNSNTKKKNKNTNSNLNRLKDQKANLPVQWGWSLGSANYIVAIGLGTPTKTLSLVFDTVSNLTWTQCQPCARSCHQQQDPIFNPSASSSYSNISCKSPQCSQLSDATGNTPACSTSTCIYGIEYGDDSFSLGYFSKDKLTITANEVFPNFLFGCGQNNQGVFGRTAGVLGLGRNSISMISQTAQKYGKYFSYCLPSTSSSTGHLTLGKSGVSTNVKFTPFASSQGTSFYFINILSISVGGCQLPISQSVFTTAGSIIDSGTVITRLPPAA